MPFKNLMMDFLAGTPIKRKVWRGCWIYKRGRIEIHTKTEVGEVVNILEDVMFTINGILQDDWEIATNDNCDIKVN